MTYQHNPTFNLVETYTFNRVGMHRKLSNIDLLSRAQTREAIDRWKKLDSIYVSPELHRERAEKCGACGHAMGREEVSLYYGEWFHKKCVDKWLAGEK